MSTSRLENSKKEKILNVISTSLTGATLGLLNAYGFEFSILLGFLIGATFGAAIGFRITLEPPLMRYPTFMLRRILLAATFMVLTSLLYSYLMDQDFSQAQRYWTAMLPLAGWAAVVITIGMSIASLDELQRRIQTEAIVIGFAITAVFVAGYALFQFAGLPDINLGLALLVMSVAWLIGKLWTLWRYR